MPASTPWAKVVDVARRHGVRRWQVCDWRRKPGLQEAGGPGFGNERSAVCRLLVETPSVFSAPGHRSAGRIERVVDGVSIRLGADVDEARLSQVVRAVRAAPR